MNARESLIQEIERAPDYILEEVLDFLLLIKIRVRQRASKNQLQESSHLSPVQSLLDLIDESNLQVPQEEWAKLPSDLSKNLDHYLYGSPKVEE